MMSFQRGDKVLVKYLDRENNITEIETKASSDGAAYVYVGTRGASGNFIGRIYANEDLPDDVISLEVTEKYYPKASFGGASARICDLVTDEDGNILFVRLAGQEDQVRSITAVMMQGRMKLGEHMLFFGSFIAKVFPEGARRIIKPIGNGMVDCVVYHRTLLPDNGMSALYHTNGDCFESFTKFLQILPIPRLYRLENGENLEREILQKLSDLEIVKKCTTHVGEVKISKVDIQRLCENDYEVLRNSIVEILQGQGYEVKAVAPDYLKDCPKLYAQDGLEYKKVYAKFFSPSMTWFITEYDPEEGECFGYVKNEADEHCSEWGYFMLDELANFKNNYPYYYVERDLHFGDDYYLDIRGNLLKEAEIKGVAA